MVRLGEYTPNNVRPATYISIPLWCGWELDKAWEGVQSSLFQFHYGAVGSISVIDVIFIND